MVSGHRKALEWLWKDQCTVYQQKKVTDPQTKLTDFIESPLLENQPCKLSFETLSENKGDPVAIKTQSVKLFLSSDVEIPPGCKIVVRRFNDLQREFVYSKSGEPGVFTDHQEIQLVPFKGYA